MKKSLGFICFLAAAFALIFVWGRGQTQAAACCPFCKEEVLQLQTFYEGEETLGVLTQKPAVPGHVLLIPKRHVERFEDLTPSEAADMQQAVREVDALVRKTYGTKGYALLQKNGAEAGQTVFHVHFHYIPNHEGGSPAWLFIKYFFSYLKAPMTRDAMKTEAARLTAASVTEQPS